MKKIISYLFIAIITISSSLCVTSCESNDDTDKDATANDIMFNGIEYTIKQADYFIDPVEEAYCFTASFISESEEKPIMLILYYPRYCDMITGENLENSSIHIAIVYGEGEISGSKVSMNRTEIKNGDITVLPYNTEGRRLGFNDLTFTTSSNPDETFTIDGYIFFKYKILDNPIEH